MAKADHSASHLPTVCGNCGAALAGPYCSACGQHAHESVRSIGALLHDAWHIATHVDSRFWKSMYFLLLKPGRLTKEYFDDHRARFLPPVRVYLVLSIIFFAFVASTSVHPPAHASKTPAAGSPPAAADSADAASGAKPGTSQKPHAGDDNDWDSDIFDNQDFADFAEGVNQCKDTKYSWTWLANHMREACARNDNNLAQPAWQAFVHNVPRTLVVFAPLIAIAMLLLYWFPRRYYVEHVVFFLHNHAAIFLILIVVALLRWIGRSLHWEWLRVWPIGLAVLYMLWYVYKSMRVFYGQGRWLTLSKMTFMYFVYFTALVLTGVAAFMIALATI